MMSEASRFRGTLFGFVYRIGTSKRHWSMSATVRKCATLSPLTRGYLIALLVDWYAVHRRGAGSLCC